MNGFLALIYLAVCAGFVVYLLKKLIGLFFRKGKIYLYDEAGRKRFWGYMKYSKTKDIYSVYGPSGKWQERRIGEVQVKDDGLAWVRCWKHGDMPDELPYELGYVNLRGEVFTSGHQRIGYAGQTSGCPDTDGVTGWKELYLKRHADIFLCQVPEGVVRSNGGEDASADKGEPRPDKRFGHCVETGRFSPRRNDEYTLIARSAAFLLLYHKNNFLKPAEEERTVGLYAWGDTALLSSVIFMTVYGLLYLMAPHYILFPFIGERLSFIAAMLLMYLLVWTVAREVKIELSLNEKPVGWWLSLFNSNVGLKGYNWLIQVFAWTGLLLSTFAFGGDFAPLMLALAIGIYVNERTYPRKVWDVLTRFVYLPDATLTVPDDEGETVRCYEWELDSRTDKSVRTCLQLRFKQEEIDRLRAENPFRQGNDFYRHVERMFARKTDPRYLAIINQHIARLSDEHKLTLLESVQFILDFVQEPNIVYQGDAESTSLEEYVRFPEETLFDKAGDCDCKAMLAAALFHNAGFRVLYLVSDTHAAVAVECRPEWFGGWDNPSLSDGLVVHEGHHYYFCETTGDRFRVGDINGKISDFKYMKRIDLETN